MVKRLSDLYQPDDAVEIKLADGKWRSGQVVKHAPPGIWVSTAGRRLWFVTNGRHIRRIGDSTPSEA